MKANEKFCILSIVLTFAIALSCLSPNTATKLTYDVYKIDSLNSWYFIYAENDDFKYKIVSKKDTALDKCFELIVGNSYEFDLETLKDRRERMSGNKFNISYNSDVNCIWLDDDTETCREEGIRTIAFTYSLKGLCHLTNR